MASGTFESIVIGGRRFTCKANDSPEFELSGYSNESLVQGDGTVRFKKTRHTGHISGINLDIDDSKDDLTFLQGLQDKLDDVSITATMVDGTVLGGSGQIIDELKRKVDENTVEINFEGKIEKM